MGHEADCAGPGVLCQCPTGQALERQLDRMRVESGAPPVSPDIDERGELIAALQQTTDMVAGLLRLTALLLSSLEAGDRMSTAEITRLREHTELWQAQLDRMRQRLASVTIEPPARVQ